MSTDRQQTISDFETTEQPKSRREIILEEGAVYGRRQTNTFEHRVQNECRNCGNDVPEKVAKVVGDNDGCVPGCPECAKSSVGGGKHHSKWSVIVNMIRRGATVVLDDE